MIKKSKKDKKETIASAYHLDSSDSFDFIAKKPDPPPRKDKKSKSNKGNANVYEAQNQNKQAPQAIQKEKTISESSIKSEQSFIEISSKKKTKKVKKDKKINRDDASISSIEIGGTIESTKSSIVNDEIDVSNVEDIVFDETKQVVLKLKDIKEKKNKADKKKINSGNNSIKKGSDTQKSVHITHTNQIIEQDDCCFDTIKVDIFISHGINFIKFLIF